MTKIDINVPELLEIAIRNKISFEELFFCYLIAFNKENGKSDLNSLFKEYYFNSRTVISYLRILDLLEEAEYIQNFNVSSKDPRLDKIIITEKGYELLFGKRITLDSVWQDVLKVYPAFLSINGKNVPARTITSEKVKHYYFNTVIAGNNHKHQEFLTLTLEHYGYDDKDPHKVDRFAKADMGLEKYIYSWESMKEIILGNINKPNERIVRGLG